MRPLFFLLPDAAVHAVVEVHVSVTLIFALSLSLSLIQHMCFHLHVIFAIMFVSWDAFLAKLFHYDKWNFKFEELIQKRQSLYMSSEKDIHFDT